MPDRTGKGYVVMLRCARSSRILGAALWAAAAAGCAAVDAPATIVAGPPEPESPEPATPEPGTPETLMSEPATSDAKRPEERETANKEIVLAFYQTLFEERRVADAFERYVGDVYIQHSPGAPEGRAALAAYLADYLADNPDARFDIKRVIAEDDLVALHVHAVTGPDDPGQAVVDIFRVEDGKVVEHWDVVQPVPTSSADEDAMF